MSEFLNIAQQYLESDEWPYERDDEKGLLKTGVSSDGQTYRVFIDAQDQSDQFICYVYGPTNVPEEKRRAAAEYLCRANYGLRIGNFEIDMSDGEVRYKTSIDVEGADLCVTMVKNLLNVGAAMMMRYYPGLLKLVYGDAEPAAVIQEIEAG